MTILDRAKTLLERLDRLAACTETPGQIDRPYLSASHKSAVALVESWMRQAGLDTRIDALGTLVGKRRGTGDDRRPLLLGSHIDSVRNAGRYDGPLGVAVAIDCVANLRDAPFDIEVLAFGDEEGGRFPGTLRGSRAVAGTFDTALLDSVDAGGISVRTALRDLGANPDTWRDEIRNGARAYLEIHIEQGPVLERADAPLGIVTSIAAATRLQVSLRGEAGHAGTVPMDGRRDALVGAAEAIHVVRDTAQEHAGAVATVGTLTVEPGAPNVIPGLVRFTIDLRAPTVEQRDALEADLSQRLRDVAIANNLALTLVRIHASDGCVCAPSLQDRLDRAVRSLGIEAPRLPSGAGHDAMAIAALTDVAMLFVRCKGGISHNPAESVTAEDVALAIGATDAFLRDFAAS
ncbi:allantoate amidohydrolase [Roseiterribacter gracilis]|uniref:Zn-dependent hydrolase n=1 Tax=Roseiterribacter gracilis TaxID=2812848 RepID=A0A8S8XDC3_9PROT|nr:Zn-dependent hydrolase [Rhodospirillales bacterium TMPK1]